MSVIKDFHLKIAFGAIFPINFLSVKSNFSLYLNLNKTCFGALTSCLGNWYPTIMIKFWKSMQKDKQRVKSWTSMWNNGHGRLWKYRKKTNFFKANFQAALRHSKQFKILIKSPNMHLKNLRLLIRRKSTKFEMMSLNVGN